jgi:tRNA(Arg) A34 adenosine deaminase TadA
LSVVAEEVPAVRGLQLSDAALGVAWESALRLAWQSFRANTTPVGAVTINGAGEIVTAGRGRRYEELSPAGQLARTHIAHAEVNALAQLSSERHWDDTLLLTTLEPCVMCHGAAIQSAVAGCYFAGRDPYGGTAALRVDNPQARRRKFIVVGPLPGPNGALAEMLHIAFLLNRATAAHVVDAQRAALPQMTEYTQRVSSALQDAATRDDYLGAVKIAASAPRDGGGPAHSTASHWATTRFPTAP